MLIIIGIASAAALSVIAYNAWRDTRPELASLATRKAQQLAAVVLVLSKAVEGVIEALTLGLRAEPGVGRAPRPLVDVWDEEDFR